LKINEIDHLNNLTSYPQTP